jgi:hypothetical protein
MLAVTMATLGPPLLSVYITKGLTTTKAKRKPVDSQLMALSETPKYSDEVVLTAEKVSQSQLTMIFNNTSWARPKKRRL